MIKNSQRIDLNALTALSKIVGANFTNSQIDNCFKQLNLSARGAESTKWKKVLFVFDKYQSKNKNSKDTIRIIENLFSPVKYIDDQEQYKDLCIQINKILNMHGLELDNTGEVVKVAKIATLADINERYNQLIVKLRERDIHEQVLKYCTAELLTDNYFHSVFEAAKSLSDRVRSISGLVLDGSKLFETAFSLNNPIIKYNDLNTESKKNQQNGLKEMINGITHYIRNVTAHEPKIKWIIDETAAIEILTVISFLHSELDKCTRV